MSKIWTADQIYIIEVATWRNGPNSEFPVIKLRQDFSAISCVVWVMTMMMLMMRCFFVFPLVFLTQAHCVNSPTWEMGFLNSSLCKSPASGGHYHNPRKGRRLHQGMSLLLRCSCCILFKHIWTRLLRENSGTGKLSFLLHDSVSVYFSHVRRWTRSQWYLCDITSIY